MSDRRPFTYTLLRYCHDVTTGEFINVGVVVYEPANNRLAFQFGVPLTRLKASFPNSNEWALQESLEQLRSWFSVAASAHDGSKSRTSVMDFARGALPVDDSSLQWAPPGSGITADPDASARQLFERLVGRHTKDGIHARRDAEVWRVFQASFQRRHVPNVFVSKSISAGGGELAFDHAWKARKVWHCLIPLSFDVHSAEALYDKAHLWLGRLAAVSGSTEELQVYFLVGKSALADMEQPTVAGLSILDRTPFSHEVIFEQEADAFADRVAKELASDKRRYG